MRTARVLVIDEDPKDAIPLLTALGQLGIGAVYISGDDVKRLPEKPIEGIRYVFLDLNLNGQNEAKNYVPYAVEVLKRSVRCTPRVTGIICWTKHKEEVAYLESILKKENIEPAFLKVFEGKLAASVDEKAAAEVVNELRSKMEENAARGILAEWEETVHAAATDSATALMQMSADDAELLKLLATIAQASSDEQKPVDAHQSTTALHAGLSAVHADAIQLRVEMNKTESPAAEELFKTIPTVRKTPLSLEKRARLNGILLTTPGNILRPGNLYCCRSCKIAGFSDDKSVRRCINDLFFSNRSRDEADWWKAFTDDVFKNAIPVCLETTPACDHAASKRSFARLIGGLLVSMSGVPNAEVDLKLPAASRLFAKESEPLLLPADLQNIKGPYKLFVSARLLMSEPVETIEKTSALFRLRHPVIADFQAWFASHAARPGYVAIH